MPRLSCARTAEALLLKQLPAWCSTMISHVPASANATLQYGLKVLCPQ